MQMLVGGVLASSTPMLRAASTDALAEYVNRPDDSFTWKKLEQRDISGFTATRLACVSQTWRGNPWHHELLVVRPPKLRNPEVAFLYISGDGNVGRQFDLLRTLAESAGALAVVINRIPNQPLYEGRKEDALIAYTFDQFLKTGDRTWPLLFPMTKSALRGMDAVQAFA
ncbi:MAG TPA: PhoPQ-activated protein PqaA family protein, partial [Clostridia bacterium]|nr:PhoPQ-activated protein PqaA family protein [Clostridia bacterium]